LLSVLEMQTFEEQYTLD